jgi:hypothetical protein
MRLHIPASRLTAAAIPVILVLVVSSSCSRAPETFTLRNLYTPVGKSLTYKFALKRVGSATVDSTSTQAIDNKMDGVVIYTFVDTLPGGIGLVREDNHWTWIEKTADSGKTAPKSQDYAYTMKYAGNGKLLDLKVVDGSSPTWDKYVRNFYEQGTPVFPDTPITVGYSWTQTYPVVLADNKTDTAETIYRVKGRAQKLGYDCAIIEYRGNLVLPIILDPADTTATQGLDRIDLNGIMYFAIKNGMAISSDERRRLNTHRSFMKAGKLVRRDAQAEDAISFSLDTTAGK